MRAWSRVRRARGLRIGFVPTMGALHEGHLELIRTARRRCDVTVLSIYVNPTQFGPGEDFERYPRMLERDLGLARGAGADAVFAPSRSLYEPDHRTVVSVTGWSDLLEGAVRPGHFDGVCTVVTKLLLAVEADLAVFGQKDAQQALLVLRMVRDLGIPTAIGVVPVVRAPDGLALSSRNAYLDPGQRQRAPVLRRALLAVRAAWESGERRVEVLRTAGLAVLQEDPPDQIDYFELIDPTTLEASTREEILCIPHLAVVTARYGSTRLLDNEALGEVWPHF